MPKFCIQCDGWNASRTTCVIIAVCTAGLLVLLPPVIMIGMANVYSLPVSTTHELSSGVAGTMVANRSGLHQSTVKTIMTAWVLTLPASMLLSASLFWLASQFIK